MRVLFFGEAVTLAHVARPLALARGLVDLGADVIVATNAARRSWVGALDLRFAELDCIEPARFTDALARGDPVYDVATLQRYVEADRRLIDTTRPDVVVGDFRLSLSVSARLAKVPYATVTNAYWSPFTRVPFPLPVLPLSRRLPLPLAALLFHLGRPVVMRSHCRPLNAVRESHGMNPLPADLRVVYTDADVVAYADDPAMFDMRPLPSGHHFLGPVLWSPPVAIPNVWGALSDEMPVVYVTLGSSGSRSVLETVLQALAGEPVQVIASSAGDAGVRPRGAHQYIASYLPGEMATARAALVVCNGGSMTTQQALVLGRPVLGIASNMDQFMNMAPLVQGGAGKCLRADRLTVSGVRSAVRTLLGSAEAARCARQLGVRLEQAGPAVDRLADLLRSAVA